MKKCWFTNKLKAVVFLLLLSILTIPVSAQYTGGSGGGYAMAETSTVITSITEINLIEKSLFELYPNPVVKGQNIYLRKKNDNFGNHLITNIFFIEISDLSGRVVWQKKLQNLFIAKQTKILQVSENWQTGLYQLSLKGKDRIQHFSLIIH